MSKSSDAAMRYDALERKAKRDGVTQNDFNAKDLQWLYGQLKNEQGRIPKKLELRREQAEDHKAHRSVRTKATAEINTLENRSADIARTMKVLEHIASNWYKPTPQPITQGEADAKL